jgi:hypothetical protein
MTRGPVVEVEGGRELRRALKGVEDGLADLKATHAKISAMVTPVAQRDAPRLTGALSASIRGTGTAAAAIVRVGGRAVVYGGPIHWGWPGHNIAAQPFLVEAGTETQPVWVGIYESDVQRLIDTQVTTKAKT